MTEPRPVVSLAGRVTALFLLLVVLMAAGAAVGMRWGWSPWTVFLVDVAVGLALGAWIIGRILRPVVRVVNATPTSTGSKLFAGSRPDTQKSTTTAASCSGRR